MAPLVLIVDDEPGIRQLLTDLLKFEGYDVETAENGWDALTVIDRVLPTLVLLDINMPILDGWGFLRHLNQRGIRLPVVVMTAGQSGRPAAEGSGAVGYLAKPFDLDELLELISHIWQPEHRVITYCQEPYSYSRSAS